VLVEKALQPGSIHVVLEWVQAGRVGAFLDYEIMRFGPDASTLLLVISKCVFDGICLPGPPISENRMF
jgi:hypothetical protein|tara:strand:+ start:914 stop:1117 length:204 start_codon:yes stop_codon:yes gene_type:complete